MPEQKQTLTIQQAIDLAVQHHTAGRLPEAESIYQQILQSDPDQPVALHLLGVIAHQVGETDTAIDLITKALTTEPDYADAHNNLGNVLKELVRMDEALAHYHKAIAIKPDFAEAHNNLGNVLKELVRMDEALAHYHKALAIKPNYADAHYNLGLALQGLGRLDEAVASFHKALAVKPDYTDAHCNLGLALQDLGRLEEAIASYHKALAVKPDYAVAYYNLGTALQKLGKLDEAVANYNNALAIKPNYANAHNNLGIALQALGKLEEALASYRKALAIKPDYAVAHSNLLFTLLSSMVDLDKIYEEHCGWETSHAMQHQPLQHQCDGDVHKRLRIGFVSADFRTHSVGYFLEAPFSSYDRERMTIYCYSNSHLEDETTARLRPLVKEWRNIVGWADEKVIDAIQADAIDILVDLSGHTRGNRLTVFARKPAPIQATWLGYPGITTGLTAIDYRLSDEVADPLGVADTLCVEQLIRLPNGHHCYHPSEDAPEIGPLPMTSNQVITFGSFNNLAKITPAVVDSWVGILQAVPRSRLLLKNASLDSPGVRERYMSLFAASIEPERIIFKAWLPSRQAHFALYNEVDIALDTFPFNGVTTTCEALWMGVPVITWCGDRHSARLGASLLTRVSLEDLVASDINGYVTTAVTLAGDPERLEGLRSGLRDRMRASPLCDGVGFAHDLESMFRNAWQNWCQQH